MSSDDDSGLHIVIGRDHVQVFYVYRCRACNQKRASCEFERHPIPELVACSYVVPSLSTVAHVLQQAANRSRAFECPSCCSDPQNHASRNSPTRIP